MNHSDFQEMGKYYDLRLEVEEILSNWGYFSVLDGEDGWGLKIFREQKDRGLPLGKIYFTLLGLEYNFDSREKRSEISLLETFPLFEKLRCAEELLLDFELLSVYRNGMEYEATLQFLGENFNLTSGKIPRTDFLVVSEIGEDSDGSFVELQGEKFSSLVTRRIDLKE